MKFSFRDSLSAPLSKRTHKQLSARKKSLYSRTQAKRQRGFRLGLELLEDRLALSGTNYLVVTSPSDIDAPGTVTLRDAINQANQDGISGTADTITFASGLNGAHILLQLGHLEVTGEASVSIWGYSEITFNGDGANIFQVDTGGKLFLNGVTMAGGTAVNGNGGAINNAGSLTIQSCTFTGNSATPSPDSGTGGLGGAIYNTGTLLTSYPSPSPTTLPRTGAPSPMTLAASRAWKTTPIPTTPPAAGAAPSTTAAH